MTKEEFQRKLGIRIADLRKKKNLTQVQFAELLDKEKQNIYRLEKGGTNPSAYLLHLIAQVLEINISELFLFEEK